MKVIEKIGDLERTTEISSEELYALIRLQKQTFAKNFQDKLKAFIDKFLEVEQKT